MVAGFREYSQKELTFYWTEEEYKEFLEELQAWQSTI